MYLRFQARQAWVRTVERQCPQPEGGGSGGGRGKPARRHAGMAERNTVEHTGGVKRGYQVGPGRKGTRHGRADGVGLGTVRVEAALQTLLSSAEGTGRPTRSDTTNGHSTAGCGVLRQTAIRQGDRVVLRRSNCVHRWFCGRVRVQQTAKLRTAPPPNLNFTAAQIRICVKKLHTLHPVY